MPPQTLINRVVNPVVRGVLRSPVHGVASGRLALITVTGRRSGRTFTFPVGYSQDGETVRITVGWPEQKQWWRNLREEAPVAIRLHGVDRSGMAVAHGDERTGVTVEVRLSPQ